MMLNFWDDFLDNFARKRVARRQALAQTANRIAWTYDHPAEVMRHAREADTRDFHAFVLDAGTIDPSAIPRRVLISLYGEFCEINGVRPMAWGKFDRSLKGAGFKRFRSSNPGRPWLYEAVRPGSAIVLKFVPAVDGGRAAA